MPYLVQSKLFLGGPWEEIAQKLLPPVRFYVDVDPPLKNFADSLRRLHAGEELQTSNARYCWEEK